jgi:hypothetical protein
VAEDKLFINTIENLADEVHYMTGDELTSYWDIESEKTAKLYKQMIEEKK